jgi:hypothetical protein
MSTVSPDAPGARLYLNGAWVDISTDVVGEAGIRVSRGRSSEAGDLQASRCSLTLMDGPVTPAGVARTPGQYSPRNTAGPYYGQLTRNTPLQYVEKIATDAFGRTTASGWGTADSGQAWTQSGGTAANYSTGSGVGVMTLTAANAPHEMVLGTTTYGSFSASFTCKPGAIATGASIQQSITFRRIDVNNNYLMLLDFETGGVLVGTLAKRVAGTATSLRNTDALAYDATTTIRVDLYVSQSYAEMTITDLADDTSTSTDIGLLSESTLTAPGTIGLRATRVTGNTNVNPAVQFDDLSIVDPRFTGEVPAWPPTWDSTGRDIRVPIEARGISGRLGQGAGSATLRSVMYRYLSARPLSGYWPAEDASGATAGVSAIPGLQQLNGAGLTFGTTGPPGSDGAFTLPDTGSFLASGDSTPGTQVLWFAAWWMRLPSVPASTSQVMFIRASIGTARSWQITMGAASTTVNARAGDGTLLDTSALAYGGTTGPDQWVYYRLQVEQVATNVEWFLERSAVDTPGTIDTQNSSFAGDIGVALTMENVGSSAISSAEYCHLALYNQSADDPTTDIVANIEDIGGGFDGERAGPRMQRLCDEEGVRLRIIGQSDVLHTALMGPQTSDTLLNNVQRCADVDQGLLFEPCDFLGLAYRTYATLYNQTAAVSLSYSSHHLSPPFLPVDDDQSIRNDITASRPGGSSVRLTQATGPLSVLAPPDGVGTYPGGGQFNAQTDGQLTGIAGWLRRLGTVDEARWPNARIELHRSAVTASLAAGVAALDAGDLFAVTGLPVGVPRDDVSAMVQGVTELRTNLTREIAFNASPGTPWNVFTVESTSGDGNNLGRADTEGSELAAAATSSATSLTVSTQIGPLWTTTVSPVGGFGIWVAGERMTVTAIASGVTDTFTRLASNGWGTADTGQAWTVTGGLVGEYSVVGSTTARQALVTVNDLHISHIDTGATDHRVRFTASVPVVPTGAAITVRAAVRLVDSSNYYEAQLSFATTGAVTLQLFQRVAGSGASITSAITLPDTHSAGNSWLIEADASGTTISGKAWKSTGTEPGGYPLTVIDTDLTAGTRVGVLFRRETSNTNGSQNIDFDNVTVANPQTFTVTRSVNGVSKAQAASTAVNLYHPPGYSL